MNGLTSDSEVLWMTSLKVGAGRDHAVRTFKKDFFTNKIVKDPFSEAFVRDRLSFSYSFLR